MSTESSPTIPFDTVAGNEAVAAEAEGTAASTAALPRPVIRWAAIIWGLAMAAIAGTVLVIVTDVERRQDFSNWLGTLTPGTFALYAVLAVGALLLVAGLAGVLRRATRQRS